MPPATIRSTVIQAATRQPYSQQAVTVMMLARPGLTPGSGLGSAASATWIASASAARVAMRRSSRSLCSGR